MNIVLKTFSTDPVTVGHFETPSLSLRDRLVLESLSWNVHRIETFLLISPSFFCFSWFATKNHDFVKKKNLHLLSLTMWGLTQAIAVGWKSSPKFPVVISCRAPHRAGTWPKPHSIFMFFHKMEDLLKTLWTEMSKAYYTLNIYIRLCYHGDDKHDVSHSLESRHGQLCFIINWPTFAKLFSFFSMCLYILPFREVCSRPFFKN